VVDIAELFSPARADINAAKEGDGCKDDGDHGLVGGVLSMRPMAAMAALRASSLSAISTGIPVMMLPLVGNVAKWLMTLEVAS